MCLYSSITGPLIPNSCTGNPGVVLLIINVLKKERSHFLKCSSQAVLVGVGGTVCEIDINTDESKSLIIKSLRNILAWTYEEGDKQKVEQ